MADLYTRIEDKVNQESPYLDVGCPKRGHVEWVAEDGHIWGVSEKRNAAHVIIAAPGAVDDYGMFMLPEQGDPVTNRMLQFRAYKVDLDTLQAAIGRSDLDKISVIQMAKQQDLLALRQTVAPRSDPNVIGEPANKLGDPQPDQPADASVFGPIIFTLNDK